MPDEKPKENIMLLVLMIFLIITTLVSIVFAILWLERWKDPLYFGLLASLATACAAGFVFCCIWYEHKEEKQRFEESS